MRRHFLTLILWLSVLPAAWAEATPTPSIGLNKFDLAKQYLGTASGGDDSDIHRRVTTAMARKAIADAADIGVNYFHIAAAGFLPNVHGQRGDLDLWISDPTEHWKRMDIMMDDLDRAGIRGIFTFSWNQLQFPAMAGETERDMIVNPRSASMRLLERYVTEFISRYKRRPTTLIYELTNEINLGADLDRVGRCRKSGALPRCQTTGNYSTDEMIAYLTRLASLVRKLDASRPISAGHSIPRSHATALRQAPEWKKKRSSRGPDTTHELERYLRDVNAPGDVISVHLYPDPGSRRFGKDAVSRTKLIQLLSRIANDAGKPLFIGEFGDPHKKPGTTGSYANHVLEQIVELRVPFSALWVWEMYDRRTFETGDTDATRFSIDPSVDTAAVTALSRANEMLTSTRKARPKSDNPADRLAPHLVLTWPLACTSIDADTILHAVAFDLSGAPKVRFLMDGKLVSEDSSPPYSATLRGFALTKGTHIIRAEAVDESGNVAAYETPVVSGSDGQCVAQSDPP